MFRRVALITFASIICNAQKHKYHQIVFFPLIRAMDQNILLSNLNTK